jgi:hypothetical protein
MRKSNLKELATVLTRLKSERDAHVAALAEIDEVFSAIGLTSASSSPAPAAYTGKRRGRPPKAASAGAKRGPKGKRGHRFPISGTTSVLEFVTRSGDKGVGGKDVDAHWKNEGRAGSSYNILGQLVRTKKIKRINLKGQRGSVYTAV